MFFGTLKENLKIGGPGLRLKRVHFVHWFLVAAKLILPLRLMRLARLVRTKVMTSVSLQSGKENFWYICHLSHSHFYAIQETWPPESRDQPCAQSFRHEPLYSSISEVDQEEAEFGQLLGVLTLPTRILVCLTPESRHQQNHGQIGESWHHKASHGTSWSRG